MSKLLKSGAFKLVCEASSLAAFVTAISIIAAGFGG